MTFTHGDVFSSALCDCGATGGFSDIFENSSNDKISMKSPNLTGYVKYAHAEYTDIRMYITMLSKISKISFHCNEIDTNRAEWPV